MSRNPEKNQIWVGSSKLTFKVTSVTKTKIKVKVQRRILDKKSGEIKIEERERTLSLERFEIFALDYEPQ